MVGGYLYHVYEQVIEKKEIHPAVYEEIQVESEDDDGKTTKVDTQSKLVKEAVVEELIRFELRLITNSAGEAQTFCEAESGKFVYTYTQCWWGMPN